MAEPSLQKPVESDAASEPPVESPRVNLRDLKSGLGRDVNQLLRQHRALARKQARQTIGRVSGNLLLIGLSAIWLALGVALGVYALFQYLGTTYQWHPLWQTGLTGLCLIVLAALSLWLLTRTAPGLGRQSNDFQAELRKDWEWLKNLI
jgi:hypothetical protein